MTLLEMSVSYADSASALRLRMSELRAAMRQLSDPEEVRALRARIAALDPLLREAKALAELTQEGLLKRRQGKGTFVEIPRLCKDLKDVNSFHDACRMMGCVPGTRVLHAQLVHAEEEDVRDLMVEENDTVVELVRLRLADDTPVMLEINHFPAAYAYLLEEDLTGSLYTILQRHGIEPIQAIHEISLSYATAAQAKQLEVNAGDALMQLWEVIYDQHQRPLHTSRQFIRGDRFTFRI